MLTEFQCSESSSWWLVPIIRMYVCMYMLYIKANSSNHSLHLSHNINFTKIMSFTAISFQKKNNSFLCQIEHFHYYTGSGCQRLVHDEWPNIKLYLSFWHTMQKEIKNVDTLTCVVHTFLTSLNLFTQPFLRTQMERVRQLRRSDREKRKKRGFEAENKGKMGFGSWGRKEGEVLGTVERGKGAFPHQMRSDMPNWGLCASGGRFRMRCGIS